jgi:hypothetical protein
VADAAPSFLLVVPALANGERVRGVRCNRLGKSRCCGTLGVWDDVAIRGHSQTVAAGLVVAVVFGERRLLSKRRRCGLSGWSAVASRPPRWRRLLRLGASSLDARTQIATSSLAGRLAALQGYLFHAWCAVVVRNGDET